jgi:hypothetical protein
VLTVHTVPSGNLEHFINKSDSTLRTLHHPNIEYITCGDCNINYLTDNPNKIPLDSVLYCNSHVSIVDFPTRIQNISTSAIDNIFIDYSTKENYYISPLFSGLSDNNTQLVMIHNVDMLILPQTN